MSREIIVEAAAKINLTLGILGKREDGYHELETIMHQVALVDRIHLSPNPKGIELDSNSRDIPLDETNLAFRAAKLMVEKNGQKAGVSIFIEKNIPVGAGLAGGSTDAAAVLLGLNSLFKYDLSREALLDMAAILGSDVPFCLVGMPLREKSHNIFGVNGATALARGRGEILSGLPGVKLRNIVIVKPDFQMSTAEVYGAFRLDKVKQFPDTEAFLQSWMTGDNAAIAHQMVNVLESVSIPRRAEIGVLKERLVEMGAANAIMSGSGPSVFGIFADKPQALDAARTLKREYQETYLVSSY